MLALGPTPCKADMSWQIPQSDKLAGLLALGLDPAMSVVAMTCINRAGFATDFALAGFGSPRGELEGKTGFHLSISVLR